MGISKIVRTGLAVLFAVCVAGGVTGCARRDQNITSVNIADESIHRNKALAATENGSSGYGTERRAADDSLKNTLPQEPEPVWSFTKDGYSINRVKDLLTDSPQWRMVTEYTEPAFTEEGLNKPVDYNKERRWFEKEDGSFRAEVRRWDNLLYSCGPYLVYEYDQTIYAAKPEALYQPVLSYDKNGTMNVITKVKDKLMVVNQKTNQVIYYDTDFQPVKTVDGIRASEDYAGYYAEGFMSFRDMETGRMGFLDEEGEAVIEAVYGAVSPSFHNGYASVLADAELEPYYEDGGAVKMFRAKGGQWGIIDARGNFVVEPSHIYNNTPEEGDDSLYVSGPCYFTDVDETGTAYFMRRIPGSGEDAAVSRVKVGSR